MARAEADVAESGSGVRFEAQARVLLAKLSEPGRGSLSLGREAGELVAWMMERGMVEVEGVGTATLVVRLPKAAAP